MSSTATRALGGATDLQKHMMLLAASDDSPIRGTVRLQHMMFMASNRGASSIRDAGFRPGERGPHSERVAEDLARLVDAGIFAPGDDIGLTPAGREAARELAAGIPARWNGNTLTALHNYKAMINRFHDDEVLVYSYCQYPHMTLHGDEYKRLEPMTENIVMSMAEHERLGVGRAAKLIHAPLTHVRDEMRRRRALRLYG